MGIFEFEAGNLEGVKGRIDVTELVEYSKDLRGYRAWLEERFNSEASRQSAESGAVAARRAQIEVEEFATGFLRDLSGEFLTRKMQALDRLSEIQSEIRDLGLAANDTGDFLALQAQSELLVREQETLITELRQSTPVEPGPEVRAEARRQLDTIARSRDAVRAEERLLKDIKELRTATGAVDPVVRAHVLDSIPTMKAGNAEEIRALAAKSLGFRPEAITVKLVEAEVGQVGVSGAKVYLVRAAEGGTEITVAAVKVFPANEAQVEEFARELSALDRLAAENLPNQGAVRRLGSGRTLEGAGVLIMSGAAGRSIDSMLVGLGKGQVSLEEVRLACQRNGEALGRLHSATVRPTPASSVVTEGFVADFETSVRDLETLSQKYPLLARAVDLPAMRRQANELVAGIRKNPGAGAVVHGDLHPGNVFYDPADGRITTIDVARTHQSIDAAGEGIASASRDAATFVSALKIFGEEYNVSARDVAQLQESFQQSYFAAVDQNAFSAEAYAFHRARYAIRQLYAALTTDANRARFTGALAEFKKDFGLK
jgi:hypothetical protein